MNPPQKATQQTMEKQVREHLPEIHDEPQTHGYTAIDQISLCFSQMANLVVTRCLESDTEHLENT
jgi:hypothetical protein